MEHELAAEREVTLAQRNDAKRLLAVHQVGAGAACFIYIFPSRLTTDFRVTSQNLQTEHHAVLELVDSWVKYMPEIADGLGGLEEAMEVCLFIGK